MKLKTAWPIVLLLVMPPMGNAQTLPTVPIYTYSAVGGYATNGNLTNYVDSATGTWAMQYDGLNRLQSATASKGMYQGLTLSWDYDSFGNRLDQTPSGTSSAPVPAPVSATYNANNQVQTSSIPGMGPASYDAAGNLVFDGVNRMAYDAENRVCAVYNTVVGSITQYIYDADGNRVAKVNATSLNGNALTCAMGAAGPVGATYLLGQSGEQITELDGSGNWKHTNVYANGQLLATYDQEGSQQLLHFNIGDPLGTKRIQTTAGGVVELTCLSLPYGDGLSCSGAAQDATEHHFTGKERDTESGNDYFGARYYSSNMGRWMSPDSINVTTARLQNPSSTLNKYAYGANNPLRYVDPDGRDITVFYERGLPTGHVMVAAYNQKTGDFAMMSVGPQIHHDPSIPLHPWSGVPGTQGYSLPTSAQELRDNFSSVTIQTNPEQAQQAIDLIRSGAGAGNWAIFGNNCTTSTVNLLQEIGIDVGHNLGLPWAPDNFMANMMALYGPDVDWMSRLGAHIGNAPQVDMQKGVDYGHPRFGMNTFDWLWMQIKPDNFSVTTSEEDHLPDGTIRRQ